MRRSREIHVMPTGMRRSEVLVLAGLCTTALLRGCGHYEDRTSFGTGHGIGVTDPSPDKDGSWWLGIEHRTAFLHSGQWVQRWDANVSGDTITVRALVVDARMSNRWWYGPPESGAHIDSLQEGRYHVVYRDEDGHQWPLATVTARRQDVVSPQQWHWSSGGRHNIRMNPTTCGTLTHGQDRRRSHAGGHTDRYTDRRGGRE